MNKRSKKAIAMAAAVTSLGAALGVATEELHAESAAPAKEAKAIKLDNVKADSAQIKLSNQHKGSTQIKMSDQHKIPTDNKGSNAIKWEYKK
ncbi:MAG: hypothetical protein HGB00_10230 [Chlorobiaceae bacterium]|nr:hypothetical protein [Chlorobiaceae bacterium]